MGGKRMTLLTTNVRNLRFTAGSALANVGTVKSVDARTALMLYVATAACACAVTAETVTFCVVVMENAAVVVATSIAGPTDGLAMIATNGIVAVAGMTTMTVRSVTRVVMKLPKEVKEKKQLKKAMRKLSKQLKRKKIL